MNGLKHGLGYFRDERAGIEYKGQYRNDKKCGYGQLTLPDHTVYRGNFENDFRHGFGEVFLNNTCIYSGYWIND